MGYYNSSGPNCHVDCKTIVSLVCLLIFCLNVECRRDAHKTSNDKGPPPNLKYVAVITRHGSRSPLSTFLNDPYPYTDKKFWPDGPGELTNLGKNQLYHTGVRLKKSYQEFLSETFYPGETEVYHNDNDRDLNSGAVLLAGLYPPVGSQVWNPKVLWQPIATRVRSFDICQLSETQECPAYFKESKRSVETLDVNVTQYKDLLELVSKSTGKTFTKLSDLWTVYDTLLMQVENKLELPKWLMNLFNNDLLKYFSNRALQLMYGDSKKLVRLGAGPELKFISGLLNAKANGTAKADHKMYIEAAHDCTLIALLYALGYQQPNLHVKTGAYIIFELHKIDEFIVKVFYFRDSFDNNPVNIKISNCEFPCRLVSFTKLVYDINPKNWHTECNE